MRQRQMKHLGQEASSAAQGDFGVDRDLLVVANCIESVRSKASLVVGGNLINRTRRR